MTETVFEILFHFTFFRSQKSMTATSKIQTCDSYQKLDKNWLQFPLSLYFQVSHRKIEPKSLLKWHCQEWQTWIRFAWQDLNYWFTYIHHILAMKYTTPALWSVSENNIFHNLSTILPVWKTKVLHKCQYLFQTRNCDEKVSAHQECPSHITAVWSS